MRVADHTYCKRHYIEEFDPDPDGDCACHISPPCGHCVRWGEAGLDHPEDMPETSDSCPTCKDER